jgi:hypothetical protein
VKRLWEHEHPYYMTEGCFYHGGCLEHFSSFTAFLKDWGKQDIDMNRIHRWDWDLETNGLDLFYVMQRKAYTYSVHVTVVPADEARVREFLRPHAELNKKLWEGVLHV